LQSPHEKLLGRTLFDILQAHQKIFTVPFYNNLEKFEKFHVESLRSSDQHNFLVGREGHPEIFADCLDDEGVLRRKVFDRQLLLCLLQVGVQQF